MYSVNNMCTIYILCNNVIIIRICYTNNFVINYLFLYINKRFTLYSRPVRSIQFLILHIKYNTYLYFSIICINNFYKKIVTFGHEAFKV